MGKSRKRENSSKTVENLKSSTIRIHVNGKFKGFLLNPAQGRVGFMIMTKKFKIGGFDENYNPIHLHCQKCENEWKRSHGELSEKFEFQNLNDAWKIRCKKCGNAEIIEKVELEEFDEYE